MNSVSKNLSNKKRKSLPSQKDEHSDNQSQIFPMRLHSIKSEIIQQTSNQLQTSNPIQNLQKLKQKIYGKMVELDKLNLQYFDKQQKMFFKTFINMMDRMSNELSEVKQKYNNIDQQINRETQCVQLRSKLGFYKDECLYLKNQVQRAQNQLEQIRTMNNAREQRNKQLKIDLTKQATKQYKYKQRKYSLQPKLSKSQIQKLGIRNLSKNSMRNKVKSYRSVENRSILDQTTYQIKNIRPTTANVCQKRNGKNVSSFQNISSSDTQNMLKKTNCIKSQVQQLSKNLLGFNNGYFNLNSRKKFLKQRNKNY